MNSSTIKLFGDRLAIQLGRTVAIALAPVLERLEERVGAVEDRVNAFVPRRPITVTTKARHRDVVRHLGNRCPCCGVEVVLDVQGCVIGEYDHFYSRERRVFHETWLICLSCHGDLTYGQVLRVKRLDAFKEYQRKAQEYEAGVQAVLVFPEVGSR